MCIDHLINSEPRITWELIEGPPAVSLPEGNAVTCPLTSSPVACPHPTRARLPIHTQRLCFSGGTQDSRVPHRCS